MAFALLFWTAATTHVSGQVAACVMTKSWSYESSCYIHLLRVDKKRFWDRLQRLRASFVDREWTLTDGVAFAAFNRKSFCRGSNWDSTPEDVERKPKGVKSSSRCMNSHMESVVPPTPQARQNGYTCEDRTTERTWHPNAKNGNTRSQPAGSLPTQTEIAPVAINPVGMKS